MGAQQSAAGQTTALEALNREQALKRRNHSNSLGSRVRSFLTRTPQIRKLARGTFRAFQRIGVNVTPAHFYWPIPKLKDLENNDWTACSVSRGVDLRLMEQVRRLRSDFLPFAGEWNFPDTKTGAEHEFHFNNGFFERIDAEIAYSMVRHSKPRRVIEVGGGNTTRLMATALRKNEEEGSRGELISIDPNPDPVLVDGFPGLTQLIARPVQTVPMQLFESLQSGDILFIDSSHVVSVGSDVIHLYLRILPQLKPGVIVHIHDIFLPAEYPEKFVMNNLCFWGEQYLLEAFLSYNRAFRVLWASSSIQFLCRDVLERYFPAWTGSFSRMPSKLKMFTPTLDNNNVWPCSFWMARTAA
jgi:hypothetical protein